MKRYNFLRLLVILMLAISGLFVGCGKSSEQTADAFLKAAEKITNEKKREELEKKAYLKYTEAVQYFVMRNKEIPVSLRTKYLKLTLQKLNMELKRFLENPEEANVDQIELWKADFAKYLHGVTDHDLLDGYSQYLISVANPDLMDMSAVILTLNEAKKLGLRAKEADDKLLALQSGFALGKLAEAERIYNETVAALKAKRGTKDELVVAEYWTLLALKHGPENKAAKELLSKIRTLLIDTYSGYERYEEALAPLDPSIDKYDIYLCVPEQKRTKGVVKMSVSLWNLTATPLLTLNDHFFVVTENGDTVSADSKESKYNKIQVDTKTDTTGVLVFKLPSPDAKIRNILYNDGSKISEKFLF